MTTLKDLQERYREFVIKRDWDQFHTPKNLAEAISIESNELMEVFLWHDNYESQKVKNDAEILSKVEEELADIVIYCIGLAEQLDIDLLMAVEAKMDENENRFDEERTEQIIDELREWKHE